jgi:hypothetical protein
VEKKLEDVIVKAYVLSAEQQALLKEYVTEWEKEYSPTTVKKLEDKLIEELSKLTNNTTNETDV